MITYIRSQPHPFHTLNTIQSHNNEHVSYRKIKAIEVSLLKSEVLMGVPYHGGCNSPDDFVELYNTSLNQLIDKFIPLKSKKVSDRPKLPWINDTITAEVRKRRRLEKICQKDINNNGEYQVFYNQSQTMCNIINKAEKDFYRKSLYDNKNDFKAIFKLCNNLLGRNLDLPLPPSVNNKC